MIDLFKYLKPKEEEEEEKEKLGSQFGGGWGIADLIKETQKKGVDLSKYIIPKGEVKAGVGAKAKVSIKPGETKKEEPDIFNALNESIEKNYKQYLSMTKKLEAYEAEYNYAPDNVKPSIAANFNQLVKEQGDLVKQVQGDIGKRDQIINRYKHLEELWKMDLPVRPSEKPEVEEKPKTLLEAVGIKKPATPEELKMGIETSLGTWEEQKQRNPELQETEDLAREVLSMKGINSSHRDAQIAYIYELLTATETEAGVPMEETIKDIQSNKEKYGSINPPKDWKKAFEEEGILKTVLIGPSDKYSKAANVLQGLEDILFKKENPGLDFLSSFGWKGMILLMGGQLTNLLLNTNFKVKDVKLNEKELTGVFRRAREALDPETGKLSSNLSDNDYAVMKQINAFLKATNKSPVARGMLEKIVEKTGGLSFPQQVNIFGTKLYAGVPIDEMVKSIVEVGKITKDIANALKVMNPVDTGLVFQQLSMVSPAIASKVASEFVELIPQKITKIPKAGEGMTAEEAEQFEKLKEAKIIPKEEIEPTEAELKEIEKLPTAKEKFEEAFKVAKMEEAEKAKEALKKVEEPKLKEAVEKPEVKPKEETISGLKKPDENLLKKIDQGIEYDLKAEVKAGVNLSTVSKVLKGNKDRLINAKVKALKIDIEGKAKAGLFGTKATAKWVDDFKRAFGKDPTDKQLKEIATEQLTKGYEEIGGKVEPDIKFTKIEEALKGIEESKKPEDRTLDMFKKPVPIIEKPIEKVEEIKKEVIKPIEEPEKFEPEPTPEEIRKVFMEEEHLDTTVKNREYFLGKFGRLFTETKKVEDTLIKQKFNEMNMLVEYEEDDIYRLAFGKEKMRVPETTKTEWIEGLGKTKYMQIFRTDKNLQYPDEIASNLGISENDLREQIMERIRTAPREVTLESAKQALIDEGSSVFAQVTAQMDAYKILLDEIEGREYSFDIPQNIKKLNAKISTLKTDSKKLMAQYEEKITALQKEGTEKRFEELKKTTEAAKKIEVEVGIKKGLKVAKAELKGRAIKGMPEKEIKEGNKLIQQIQMMVKDRGFTNKQFSDIKMTHGGARHLTGKTKRMTIPQLQAVLRAVELARPRRIGAKQVVSLKTENKIQSLKDTLIEEQQMNEKRYEEILKEEGIYKEPKYIDAIHFITEKQGKKLIYRLLNESNILKITEPYRRAREAHPEIKKVWDKLHKRNVLDPEKTLKDPHDLQSMRRVIQKMGRISGADFYPVYRALIDVNLECRRDLHNFIKGFDKHKEVIKDKERLKVAESWILSKSNLEGKPEVPKDITEGEITFAKDFETVLKDYQPTARTQQFLDNIEHLENMPQYNQYRKEMNKARDIFESKGLNALEEYLKDQKWGVITSGYDPMQVISPKVRAYKSSPLVFGKGHIKFRTDIEYQEQDKDMFQRLVSYKKSMDNLSKVREKLLALYQLTDNNLSKFKDPNHIKDIIEEFARELRGYNTPKNWFDRIFVRAYAQAMKTIVMPSPVLAIGRNLVLGQNMAIGHDKNILIDPRNKTLTKDDIEFVETFVIQQEFMKFEWFESREKPLPGMATITKWVEKCALYPWSDSANRWWCFWGKINQTRRAFTDIDKYSTEAQIEKAMWKTKFSDFALDEQMMAMDILAKDGVEAMERFIAKTYTDDVHFIYQRARRAPAEMGRVGRIWGNLILWARAYWEKLFYHTGKVIGKNVPFKERWRGLEVLSNIIIGGLLVGAAYMKVTGRREAPYHPLNLLAYTPGGLQVGTVEAIGDVYANMVLAVKGDKRAIAALATDFPHAADMFIPFYDYALRAVEASTDTKNIDVLALRKIRMLLDKEYKVRGGAYVVNRNALERWQYFLAGAGVDVSIKEKEKKEKEKGKFYTKIKFPEKSKFTKIKFPKRP